MSLVLSRFCLSYVGQSRARYILFEKGISKVFHREVTLLSSYEKISQC